MMPELKELIKKKAKEGKFLSEDEKAAKMEMLNGVKEILGESMSDKLKGAKMQKVTVASPTPEGLVAGLDKAEEVVESKIESEDSEDEEEACPECEMEDKPEMMMAGLSKDEKIKKLEEELAKLKSESEEEAMA